MGVCNRGRRGMLMNRIWGGTYIAYVNIYIDLKYSMCVCACVHVHAYGVSNIPNKREREEGGGSVLVIMYIQITFVCRVMQ